MKGLKLNTLVLFAIAALVSGIAGCGGSKGPDIANLSGTWQNPSEQQKIQINANGENKIIEIGDQKMPFTIKQVEVDQFVIRVSDASSGEKDWKLSRIWDDTGKEFKLRFERDGKTLDLIRVQG